ncbi:MAG: hypothetical protein Q4A00_01670 [Flavobacteriaceae bacterium]|nr:hypothetical protein [Flavobacteriaceae bacterium]
MKQTFYKLKTLCALGIGILGHAQQGKVGINTETPTRVLDINGDLRIRNLDLPSSFDGILVSEKTKTETNVVRKAEIKGKQILYQE